MSDANSPNSSAAPEISPESVPVLNKMFRFQWEKAQDCYVLLYPEGMIQLNGPAGEILSLVDGQRNVSEITSAIEAKFPDAGDLSGDIVEFLGEAHGQHWITL
ncbi:pyrroloquinoline quinone biosynthesis peptide chaperone PqqD [uncultured Neptuniibacter sp.]|uniref:pyrroloquinoline quinone biosynthesis peptide chaperone PqqD n=1 Tax=uncultured Neptuniibacter sp. TaxID=502143 RepID=UPI0032B27B07|tara:strand:- start:6 stop:314 length:309 start_codon:yes stop_codon:yes gene_type:complete